MAEDTNGSAGRFLRIENKIDDMSERMTRVETILSERNNNFNMRWIVYGVASSFIAAMASVVYTFIHSAAGK
jgi:hypothetical protein